MATEPNKKNSKLTTSAIVFVVIFLLIIIGVTIYVLNRKKTQTIPSGSQYYLQPGNAQGISTSSSSSSGNSVVTEFSAIKVGDKIFADTATNMYVDSSFSTYNKPVILCNPGEWVGQVLEKGAGYLKVRNYSVKWNGQWTAYQNQREFFVPAKKYKVNNS